MPDNLSPYIESASPRLRAAWADARAMVSPPPSVNRARGPEDYPPHSDAEWDELWRRAKAHPHPAKAARRRAATASLNTVTPALETSVNLTETVTRLTTPPAPIDNGIRSLTRRGFDVQGGYLLHRGTPVYPAIVLDAGGDKRMSATERATLRATLTPSYESAFTKWLSRALNMASEMNGRPTQDAFRALPTAEQDALREGTSSDGGFLAPASLAGGIASARAAASVVRPLVRALTTAGSSLKVAAARNHTTDPGLYANGFVGGWYGETESITLDDNFEFQSVDIALRKARAACRISNDLIADAEGVAEWLAAVGGENLAAVEDFGYLNGSGASNEPFGIIPQYTGTAVDIEGTTSNTVSNTTGDAGSAPKLIGLAHGLPSQYQARARWFLRAEVEGDVRKLVNAQGGYLWPRTGPDLMGWGISNSDGVPNDGTNGNRCVLFGDLTSACVIAEKSSVVVSVDAWNRIATDEVQVFLKHRSGIGIVNQSAIKVGAV